jgi:hypothetical protein
MSIQGRSYNKLTSWFPVALVAYKILTTHAPWRSHQWFGRQVILPASTHAGSPPLGRQGGGQPGCHHLCPSCAVHPLLNPSWVAAARAAGDRPCSCCMQLVTSPVTSSTSLPRTFRHPGKGLQLLLTQEGSLRGHLVHCCRLHDEG